MQKESGLKWKLGMFVTIALVLLVATLFFLGKQKNLFGSVFHIKSVFNNVSGLKMGNNVRFGGINVGTVDGIYLITDTSVMVDMVIQENVHKFIKKDASAGIGSEGLMGDKVVVITPGGNGQQLVSENEILVSRAPVETDQILSSLKTSADNAAIITHDLASISSKINNGHGTLARLIGDSSLSNNLNKTVANLKQGSEGLKENMEAAKHNFLLKGYFKKKKREEEKKKEEAEKKKQEEDESAKK
jgi:phospholipid/cholesterol/gamma-HCH transport system substrate-binding protein